MILDTQEGRRHAIGILVGAVQSFTRDGLLMETLEHLRQSASEYQNID